MWDGGLLFHNLWMKKWCTPGCSILAYIVLCLYNDLIVQLKNLKVGYQLNCLYLGIWVFADDIISLSPSRSGLQLMTYFCEKFASFHQWNLSTNIDDIDQKHYI